MGVESVAATLLIFGISSAVTLKMYLYVTAPDYKKGVFFMFKNSLNFKKISTRDLCFMAMLVAITLMLSAVSGYLRIGDAIKFNISFISVYVGAALYGPLAGGIIAAMADIISFLINPTGAFIPIFTVMEFVNGLFFGVFLYRNSDERRKTAQLFVLAFICTLFQFCVNMFWRTYELSRLYGSPFWALFGTRLPGNVVMIVCKTAIIMLLEPYMKSFRKLVFKNT